MDSASSRASLRDQARRIWQAGVDAIDSSKLVADQVQQDQSALTLAGLRFPLDEFDNLIVVGGGKAGLGMVEGLETQLERSFLESRVKGWVNVPADCVRSPEAEPISPIHVHAARPAGVNEPRPEGVLGTRKILELLEGATQHDLCVVLLSGGGSALLPAPLETIPLDDKLFVTRELSRRGATIEELNLVRTHLSRLKGGGLAGACRAGHLVSLIISDVIGDPLETIASGPTVFRERNSVQALQLLETFLGERIPLSVRKSLEAKEAEHLVRTSSSCPIDNRIIGSNSIALAACRETAESLGYTVVENGSDNAGEASEFGKRLIQEAAKKRPDLTASHCFLYGGETTVSMTNTSAPGKGGRNQEVALAAALEMESHPELRDRCILLAGGTDGEDGPTDAAGGFADFAILEAADSLDLSLEDSLQRHDAYHFLEKVNGLLKTGPTHTNVMDVTVVLLR